MAWKAKLKDGTVFTFPEGVSKEEAQISLIQERPELFPDAPRGFLAGVESGFKGMAGSLAAAPNLVMGKLLGDEERFQRGIRSLEESELSAAQALPDPVSIDDVIDAYNDEGLAAALGEVGSLTSEAMGQSATYMLPMLGAAKLAGTATAGSLAAKAFPSIASRAAAPGVAAVTPAAKAVMSHAAGGSSMIPTFFAENLSRQVDEGVASAEDLAIAKAAIAAPFQSAMEYVFVALMDPTRGAAKRAAAASLTQFLKTQAVEASSEIPTEMAQTAIELLQADSLTPSDVDDIKEIVYAGITGGLVGGGYGAVSTAIQTPGVIVSKKLAEEDLKGEKILRDKLDEQVKRNLDEEAALILSGDEEALQRRRLGLDWVAGVGDEEIEAAKASVQGRTVQPDDIHKLADRLNINWDNDLGFEAFSRELTGEGHIDDMNDDHRQLLYDRLSKFTKQDSKRSLTAFTEDQYRKVLSDHRTKRATKGRAAIPAKRLTVASITKTLGLEKNNATDKKIARAIRERAVARKDAEWKGNSVSLVSRPYTDAQYASILQQSLDRVDPATGESSPMVTREIVEGVTGKKNLNLTNRIRKDMIDRGDARKERTEYFPVTLESILETRELRSEPSEGFLVRDGKGVVVGGAATEKAARSLADKKQASDTKYLLYRDDEVIGTYGHNPDIKEPKGSVRKAKTRARRQYPDSEIRIEDSVPNYSVSPTVEEGVSIIETGTDLQGDTFQETIDFVKDQQSADESIAKINESRTIASPIEERVAARAQAEAVRRTKERLVGGKTLEEEIAWRNKLLEGLMGALSGIGLEGVRVRLAEIVGDPDSQGYGAEGNFDLNNIIRISLQRLDPNIPVEKQTEALIDVMNHEMIHAMRRLDLFTQEEWEILKNYVRETVIPGNRDGLTYLQRIQGTPQYANDLAAGIMNQEDIYEEAVAEAFRGYMREEKNFQGEAKTLLGRIKNFMVKVGNYLVFNKFSSPQDILSSIRTGEVASRKRNEIRTIKDVDTPWGARYLATAGDIEALPEKEARTVRGLDPQIPRGQTEEDFFGSMPIKELVKYSRFSPEVFNWDAIDHLGDDSYWKASSVIPINDKDGRENVDLKVNIQSISLEGDNPYDVPWEDFLLKELVGKKVARVSFSTDSGSYLPTTLDTGSLASEVDRVFPFRVLGTVLDAFQDYVRQDQPDYIAWTGATDQLDKFYSKRLKDIGEAISFPGGKVYVPLRDALTETERLHSYRDETEFGNYDSEEEFRAFSDSRSELSGSFVLKGIAPQELAVPAKEARASSVSERLTRLQIEIPGLKGVMPYLTISEREKLKRNTAKKLVSVFENLPSAGEIASVAYAGRAKRGWYRDSAQALVDIFGVSDAPRFAALLAAMSPRTSVSDNATMAINTWVNWINAGRPTDRKKIISIMVKSIGGTSEKSLLRARVPNSIRALTSKDPSSLVISGPKVNSFVLNLRDNVNEVTNDAWMAYILGVDQKLFSGSGITKRGYGPDQLPDPGKGPGYIAASALIRKAAKILSRRTGDTWTPAQVQETVWSWAKAITEQRLSADEQRTAVELVVEQGGPDVDRLIETPDFALLFTNEVYGKILGLPKTKGGGGYGKGLRLARERREAARLDRERRGEVGDADPGVAARTFAADLRRAAGRLDERVERGRVAKEITELRRTETLRQVDKPGDYRRGDRFSRVVRGRKLSGIEFIPNVTGYPVVLRLDDMEQSKNAFLKFLGEAKKKNRYAASVTLPDIDDMGDYRLFISEDGMSGFALNGNDVVSVFKIPYRGNKDGNTASALLSVAIDEGGRRLDAFDTVLPGIYSDSNFRAVARLKWSDEYQPEGWDKAVYDMYNNGEPDVVFMVNDPYSGKDYSTSDGMYVSTYEEGEAMQKAALEEIDARKKVDIPTKESRVDEADLVPAKESRFWEPIGNILNSEHLKSRQARIPTKSQLEEFLASNQIGKIWANRLIGQQNVRLRIDISFFNNTVDEDGVGMYGVTVHPEKGWYPAIGYDSVVRLSGKVDFDSNYIQRENAAEKVRTEGNDKGPFAVVAGMLVQDKDLQEGRFPDNIDKWTPVGFNPHKAPFFYNKRTGQEVTGGTNAISIGNTVYVEFINPETDLGTRNVSDIMPGIPVEPHALIVPDKLSMAAYHGSPHLFRKFLLEKMGSGEGSQAYGWGLYFAEEKSTAEWYGEAPERNLTWKDEDIDSLWTDEIGRKFGPALSVLPENEREVMEWILAEASQMSSMDQLDNYISKSNVTARRVWSKYRNQFAEGKEKSSSLYNVSIDLNKEDLLDLDKPLSMQSEKVRDSLSRLDRENFNPSGLEFIEEMESELGSDEQVSKALFEVGIPGSMYLDQMSRVEGSGTRNFVIWDEEKIKIQTIDGKTIEEELVPPNKYSSIGAIPRINTAASERAQQIARGEIEGEKMSENDWKPFYIGVEKYSSRLDSEVLPAGKTSSDYIKIPEKTTFFDLIMDVLKGKELDKWLPLLRQKFVDKYASIAGMEERIVKKMREEGKSERDILLRTMAGQSSWAAAYRSDRAAGLLQAAVNVGIPVWKAGRAQVQKLAIKIIDPKTGAVTDGFGGFSHIFRPLFRNHLGENLYYNWSMLRMARREKRFREEGRGDIRDPKTDELLHEGLRQLTPDEQQNYIDIYDKALEKNDDGTYANPGHWFHEQAKIIEVVDANFNAWNDGFVKFLMKSGVISPEVGAMWMKYGDYLPFYRQWEEESSGKENRLIEAVLDTARKGNPAIPKAVIGSITGVPVSKKAVEGKKPVLDPMSTILHNSLAAITSAIKNDAAEKTMRDAIYVGLARKLGVKGKYRVDSPPDWDEDGNMIERPPEVKGDPIVGHVHVVRENGIEIEYEVTDDLLHNSLEGFTDGKLPYLSFIAAPSTFLREMVTRSPDFMLANLLRDTVSAWATSGSEFRPFIDTFKHISSDQENEESWNALRNVGLNMGFDFGRDMRSAKDAVDKQWMREGVLEDPANEFWRTATKIWDWAGDLTTKTDMATRQAVYEDVLKRLTPEYGVDIAEVEAEYQAQEIINFSRRGNSKIARYITAAVPFLNARVQGLDVLYRAGMGRYSSDVEAVLQKKAQLAFIARMGTLAAIAATYWFLVKDDEEYRDARPEVRQDNIILPNFGLLPGSLKIPKPFEVGLIAFTIPELMLELIAGKQDMRQTTDAIKRGMMVTFEFNPVPQAIKPLYESYMNRSFFTGRPIVPYFQEKLKPELQSGAYTNTFALLMGDLFNASPSKIEHVLRGYTGTIGSYILFASDAALRPMTDYPTRPNMPVDKMPMFRRFWQGKNGGGRLAEFYEFRAASEELVNSVLALKKQGRIQEARELMKDNLGLMQTASRRKAMNRSIQELRKHERAVIYSNKTGAEKKRAQDRIKELQKRILKDLEQTRERANVPLDLPFPFSAFNR